MQKETRSFVRMANAGFVADADLMRSRRSAASALGGLGGVVGMISLFLRAADGVYGAQRRRRRGVYVVNNFLALLAIAPFWRVSG